MPAAMMVSGVGFILIGAAAFIGDCRTAVFGDSCESTTIASLLQETNIFYYNGASDRFLNDLMFLPFSYVALAFGAIVFMAGAGIGSLRGL